MEFNEKISEGKTIIPGYESLFDRMASTDNRSRDNLKRQYAEASQALWKSTTIAALYSAVQKVINLPPAENETDMKSSLLSLAFAIDDIPLADRRIEVEQAIEFVEHRVMPRLNTLTGGPQPKIDGESTP